MRCAAIDIGTNTLLLLIADVSADGEITPLADVQHTPRLGKDVDAQRNISQAAFERIEQILIEYVANCRGHAAERITACATSAVRDARNRDEFLHYQRERTGVMIEVLSGEEEAELTFTGAVSGLTLPQSNYAVLDIGGGSTEISFLQDGKTIRRSLQIGSVRVTERFFRHQPPLRAEFEAAKKFVRGAMEASGKISVRETEWVGVAGTVTSLSCFEQHLPAFDPHKVNNFLLSADAVHAWSERLALLAPPQIRSLSSVAEGRADILTAGAMILAESMDVFQIDRIRTSIRGLRFGIALKAAAMQ